MIGVAGVGQKKRRLRLLLATWTVALLSVSVAWAHDARPLSISIAEYQEHRYRVDVRMPSSITPDNQPELLFPERCTVQVGGLRPATDSTVKTLLVACPDLPSGLEGQRIGLRYALFNPSLSTLVRFTPAESSTRSLVLPPDRAEWVAPTATSWKSVALDYLVLGIGHIATGFDHLLFVTGLLLLARSPRRVVVAVTGFTLAHSVTLSLAALGLVRLPLLPIEAGIALSILFLAREVASSNPASLARRYPLAVSSSFGLLHGFGFASALHEAGLPREEISTALLFFNAGVEAGQLVFIAIVIALTGVATVLARAIPAGTASLVKARAEQFAAYGLGVPAAFWLVERIRAFWA